MEFLELCNEEARKFASSCSNPAGIQAVPTIVQCQDLGVTTTLTSWTVVKGMEMSWNSPHLSVFPFTEKSGLSSPPHRCLSGSLKCLPVVSYWHPGTGVRYFQASTAASTGDNGYKNGFGTTGHVVIWVLLPLPLTKPGREKCVKQKWGMCSCWIIES